MISKNKCGNTKAGQCLMIMLAATCLSFPAAALADDNSTAPAIGSTRIQIQRRKDPLQASASVERDLGSLNNDEASKLRSIFAQQAETPRPAAFRGNAAQDDTNFRGQTPMLDRVFRGQSQQNSFLSAVQTSQPDNAPYIWCQSVQGGYYDGSGTYKGVVPGYRLHELGGKFADGTPVPQGNVKMNEAGHIWWQSDLSKSFRHY